MDSKFLDRTEAADYIKARGLIFSPKTLGKLATVGGGPLYRKFGKRAVYKAADLDAWIESRLSAPTTTARGVR
jgi:hypothetical protein